MFVAVATESEDLMGLVSAKFEQCKYVLIVNMDSMDVKVIAPSGDPTGADLAQAVIDHDCEAIITGGLCVQAFDLLAGASVTRYDGYGNTAKDAIVRMDRYQLKLIRDVEGNDDCQVSHSEDSCQEHRHD